MNSWPIYGSGFGQVVDKYWDEALGNVVVVKYQNVLDAYGNKISGDVFVLIAHTSNTDVNGENPLDVYSTGQLVTDTFQLAYMNKTGTGSQDTYHAHVEVTIDSKYPYTPALPLRLPYDDYTVDPFSVFFLPAGTRLAYWREGNTLKKTSPPKAVRDKADAMPTLDSFK